MNTFTLRNKILNGLAFLVKPFLNFFGLKYFLQFLSGRLFLNVEKLGWHITGVNYSSPIPNVGHLKRDIARWYKPKELVGLDMNIENQLNFLEKICPKYTNEYNFSLLSERKYDFIYKNWPFKEVDADMYYCMVRHLQPRIVVEVGGGGTTLVCAKALEKNKSETNIGSNLLVIDPYPVDILKNGFKGFTELLKKEVEDVDLNYFQKLAENDILFIDSSHVVRVGGDVIFLYLEVIPRLRKGVVIQAHDIFFPFPYPQNWTVEATNQYWTEQYLLQALLTFSDYFKILWCGSYIHHTYPERIKGVFKNYQPALHLPGSFWFQKVK